MTLASQAEFVLTLLSVTLERICNENGNAKKAFLETNHLKYRTYFSAIMLSCALYNVRVRCFVCLVGYSCFMFHLF